MNIKKHIPNAITCCNLLCGCLAIVQTFEGNLVWAAYLVGLAAIFDFFDGFVARLLNVTSPIGKDLDSLADMVTFGAVPGFLMFQYLIALESFSSQYNFIIKQYSWINYIAFLMIVFSAIRLAKFNNDTRQSESFVGVPTPANAIFWCSILFLDQSLTSSIITPYSVIVGIIVASFLLIAEIPLFALKFKHFGWKDNEIRYTFLGLSLLLLVALQFVGIPLIIILYIVMSIINNMIKKKIIS